MSDDRPAIVALNEALERHGIGREYVSMLNQIKLDILFPEDYEQQRADREETVVVQGCGKADSKVDEAGHCET